jgi:hypothetical protein
VTTEEELDLLEQQLRRLKIEYEMFFNNPAKRPPADVEWKVLSLLRKFSDSPRLSFSQRFKYNAMAQRYAIQSDLWRKKMRIREEGYRRPQDALLSVQGVRVSEERETKHHQAYGLSHHAQAAGAGTPGGGPGTDQPGNAQPGNAQPGNGQPFSIQCSGATAEREQVESLYKALTEAKQKSGEKVSGNLDSFAAFVKKKTSELRKQHGCDTVVYSVETQGGQVKLKAKAKT